MKMDNDPSVGVNPENDAAEEKRALLDLQIREALQRIEAMGEGGEIQAAQELSSQVELWRVEVDRLKNSGGEITVSLEKRMSCAAHAGPFSSWDAPKRIEAHFEGRQHNGWARVRQALNDYRKSIRSSSMAGGGWAGQRVHPDTMMIITETPLVVTEGEGMGRGGEEEEDTLDHPSLPDRNTLLMADASE